MKKFLLVSSLIALFSLPLWGAEQTVTLDVPGMTCAACPITVKTALNRVEGVSLFHNDVAGIWNDLTVIPNATDTAVDNVVDYKIVPEG